MEQAQTGWPRGCPWRTFCGVLQRGVDYLFDLDVVSQSNLADDIDMICQVYQQVSEG